MSHLKTGPPTLRDQAPRFGGLEDAEREDGSFHFETGDEAVKAAEMLGAQLRLPKSFQERPCWLRANKRGVLVYECEWQVGDRLPGAIEPKQKRHKRWIVLLGVLADQRPIDEKLCEIDEQMCYLVGDGENGPVKVGIYMRDRSGRQVVERDNYLLRCRLATRGITNAIEQAVLIGRAAENPHHLVHLPFEPEYADNRPRTWNAFAPQYAVQPSADPGDDQHWLRIMRHNFADLDDVLPDHPWGKRTGIITGEAYGVAWVANLFRNPFEHLPFLFFFGDEDCGKSIFHEAISTLMTKGVASADRAFTNSSNFNGELAHAVLAYVEETNIASDVRAYNRLKDWVMSPTLYVRKMFREPYPQRNTLHFVQCANDRSYTRVSVGDTRIMPLHVANISPKEMIPKGKLMAQLRAEAPFFLHRLLHLTLPAPVDRMQLPCIVTEAKLAMQAESVHPLALQVTEFIALGAAWTGTAKELAEHCDQCPKDFRAAMRVFGNREVSQYLRDQGITVAEGGKSNTGRRLIITHA